MSVKQFIFFGYFLNKKFILYFANLNYHKIYKIMIKEFKISDILNAVDSISKMDEKKNKTAEKNDALTHNNQAKSNNSEILVLDQMIEQNNRSINKKIK